MIKMIGVMMILVSVLSGCAHCSRTVTNFNGKTNGLNPYGKGDIKVDREAYWGNLKCILKLVNKEGNVVRKLN